MSELAILILMTTFVGAVNMFVVALWGRHLERKIDALRHCR